MAPVLVPLPLSVSLEEEEEGEGEVVEDAEVAGEKLEMDGDDDEGGNEDDDEDGVAMALEEEGGGCEDDDKGGGGTADDDDDGGLGTAELLGTNDEEGTLLDDVGPVLAEGVSEGLSQSFPMPRKQPSTCWFKRTRESAKHTVGVNRIRIGGG